LSLVDTDYACWLDSDDVMDRNRLYKQRNEILKGYDIVFSGLQYFKYELFKGLSKPSFIDVTRYSQDYNSLKNNTACATAFFKKELAEYPFYDLKFGSEDVIWLYRNILQGKKIGYVKEVLYYARFHAERVGNYKKLKVKEKSKENKIVTKAIVELQKKYIKDES